MKAIIILTMILAGGSSIGFGEETNKLVHAFNIPLSNYLQHLEMKIWAGDRAHNIEVWKSPSCKPLEKRVLQEGLEKALINGMQVERPVRYDVHCQEANDSTYFAIVERLNSAVYSTHAISFGRYNTDTQKVEGVGTSMDAYSCGYDAIHLLVRSNGSMGPVLFLYRDGQETRQCSIMLPEQGTSQHYGLNAYSIIKSPEGTEAVLLATTFEANRGDEPSNNVALIIHVTDEIKVISRLEIPLKHERGYYIDPSNIEELQIEFSDFVRHRSKKE
jgi:hypothetical protein